MEVREGYRQSDLGMIPADWCIRRLGEIGDCLIGLTYSPANVRPDGILVLRSSNVENGGLVFEDNVFVDVDVPDKIMVRQDDLLICVRNGSRPLIGKCALIDHRALGMTFGAFMSVFRSPHNRYIFYQFQSDVVKRQINEHLGATINQITNKSLNSFRIAIPEDEEEQRAIAAALSDVDALNTSLNTLIAKKRDMKLAAMQELLTGKRRLPGFSGEWEVKQLGSLGTFRGGSGFPTTNQGDTGGDYPFFKVSDMNNEGNSTFMINSNNWISENTRKQIGANTFPANTIVFAKIGAAIFLERKRILSQESCIDNNMMGLVLDDGAADHRFVHYLFLSIQLSKLVAATALPSLNGREIAGLSYGIPKVPEQQAIATLLSGVDAEIVKLEQKRDKTIALRQGMMQELLTGRIRLVKLNK